MMIGFGFGGLKGPFDVPWVGNPHYMLTLRAAAEAPLARKLADLVLPFRWQDYLDHLMTACVGDVSDQVGYFMRRADGVRNVFVDCKPDIGVELGSGFSLNGLTSASLGRQYFESDLPDVAELKRAAVPELIGPTSRLCISPLDVSDAAAVDAYLRELPKRRPTIVLEALFPWIPGVAQLELLELLAQHLRRVGGGSVIITDIYLVDLIERTLDLNWGMIANSNLSAAATMFSHLQLEAERERRLRLASFASFQEARDTFASYGFKVTAVDLDDTRRTFPEGPPFDETKGSNGSNIIWVLEI